MKETKDIKIFLLFPSPPAADYEPTTVGRPPFLPILLLLKKNSGLISRLTNELISALISERYSLADSNSFFRLQNKRSNRCFSILIEKEIITSPYFCSVEPTIEMNSFFPTLYSNMNRSSTRWTPRHMLRLLKLPKNHG